MQRITLICLIFVTLISCAYKNNIRANKNFTPEQWTLLFEDLVKDITNLYHHDLKSVDDELSYINEIQASGDIVISTTWIDDPRIQKEYLHFDGLFNSHNPTYFGDIDLSKTLQGVESAHEILTSKLGNLEFYKLLDESKHLFVIEFSKPFQVNGKYYCLALFGFKPVYYSQIWSHKYVYEFEKCNDNTINVHTRHGPAVPFPKYMYTDGVAKTNIFRNKLNEKCSN